MPDESFPCPWCRGTGKRALSKPALRIFKVLQKVGPATCSQVFAVLNNGQNRTVVNKHINKMIKMRVVTRVSPEHEHPPRYAVA